MTIWFQTPSEIDFWGIYERGIPNSERIVFRPLIPIELGRYFVAVAVRQPDGQACASMFDNAFFFPDVVVEPPTWVIIYTGRGKSKVTIEPYTRDPVHALFWQRDVTIFNAPNLVAYIGRLDALHISPEPPKSIDPSMRRLPSPSK